MSPFDNESAATATEPAAEQPSNEPTGTAELTKASEGAFQPIGEPLGTGESVPSAEPAAPAIEEPTGETVGGEPEPSDSASLADGSPETTDETEKTDEPSGESEAEVEQSGPPIRRMAGGTKLQFGNTTVTLANDAVFTYDEAENEQHFAATCQMTGNYAVNAHLLEKQYDLNGRVIEG